MKRANFHPKVCSWLPFMVRALAEVGGDVLELGTGLVSTPFLHWMCFDQGRRLASYESDPEYYGIAKLCEADFHVVRLVGDWGDAEVERPWGIALVDHAPACRRRVEAARLADWAQVVLLHDAHWYQEKHYHYKEIYPLYRYRRMHKPAGLKTWTAVVSNFVDVGAWA